MSPRVPATERELRTQASRGPPPREGQQLHPSRLSRPRAWHGAASLSALYARRAAGPTTAVHAVAATAAVGGGQCPPLHSYLGVRSSSGASIPLQVLQHRSPPRLALRLGLHAPPRQCLGGRSSTSRRKVRLSPPAIQEKCPRRWYSTSGALQPRLWKTWHSSCSPKTTMGQLYSRAAAATSRSEPQDLGPVSPRRYALQPPGSPAAVGILPENHALYLELSRSM